MIYVEYKDGKVTQTHFKPFDEVHGLGKTEAELKKTGALIESFPEPEQREGYDAVLMYHEMNNELYYEYVKRPATPQEEIKTIKDQLAQSLLREAEKDQEIKELKAQNATIMMKLALNGIR